MIKPHKAQNPGLTTSPVVLGSDIQTLLDASSSFQVNSNHEPVTKRKGKYFLHCVDPNAGHTMTNEYCWSFTETESFSSS
jgi:hypothetical protein